MATLSYCFAHEVTDECTALAEQRPIEAAPAKREPFKMPVIVASEIISVEPYIDVVDGHGHIIVAHGVHRYEDGKRTTSPLVNLICCICNDTVFEGPVEFTNGEPKVVWSRVSGNSRYGYEPYHLACCR